MAVLTATYAELRWNGQRVAKVRDLSLDITKDALETTSLGDYDRTYVPGVRGTSGSGTLLYDNNDGATVNLLNTIFNNQTNLDGLTIALNTPQGIQFEAAVILTSVGIALSTGEVISCSIQFQLSGDVAGRF
jgi:hypothetical protein